LNVENHKNSSNKCRHGTRSIQNKSFHIENNILKYGEPWTGDIWKTIYYILLNNKNDIEYKYYLNNTFRGLLELKIINKFQINQSNIDVINNYSYFDDYPKYLNILCNL
jgi:hypothetical protein